MLSKASEYAIRALVYIETKNRGNNRPGYREIAAAIDAPEQFTAKILQSLVRQGMLNSVRGRGGGFFFDADADPLKLVDVITSSRREQTLYKVRHWPEPMLVRIPMPYSP